MSTGSSKSKCKSFLCNAQQIGWIREDAAEQLRRYSNVFIEHADRYVKKRKQNKMYLKKYISLDLYYQIT